MNGIEVFAAFAAASYVNIFLRAAQQLNVIHDRVWWVVPASVGMSACEVFLVVSTVSIGPGWIILWGGVGAGLGTLSAMLLNRRFFKK